MAGYGFGKGDVKGLSGRAEHFHVIRYFIQKLLNLFFETPLALSTQNRNVPNIPK